MQRVDTPAPGMSTMLSRPRHPQNPTRHSRRYRASGISAWLLATSAAGMHPHSLWVPGAGFVTIGVIVIPRMCHSDRIEAVTI